MKKWNENIKISTKKGKSLNEGSTVQRKHVDTFQKIEGNFGRYFLTFGVVERKRHRVFWANFLDIRLQA